MNDKLVRKEKELGGVQQKLIDAVEEEKTIAEERLRNSVAERRPVANGNIQSDEEDTRRGTAAVFVNLANHLTEFIMLKVAPFGRILVVLH